MAAHGDGLCIRSFVVHMRSAYMFLALQGMLSCQEPGCPPTESPVVHSHVFDTTLVNQGLAIQMQVRDINDSLLLLSARHGDRTALADTIDSRGLLYIEYPDFDSDGNADILIDYIGNNSTYFLYLYDPASVRFRSIEGYVRFPDAVQLQAAPECYYSYHRAGCADMDWVSDLFKIVDFKIIHLGHIYGKGCSFDDETSSPVIEISKVESHNGDRISVLLEELPYRQYIPEHGDKWDFIRDYWNKNYSGFE